MDTFYELWSRAYCYDTSIIINHQELCFQKYRQVLKLSDVLKKDCICLAENLWACRLKTTIASGFNVEAEEVKVKNVQDKKI